MGIKKYNPDTWYWPKWDKQKWFLVYNHWLCPFGNWLEPMPIPIIRVKEAKDSYLRKWFGEDWGCWLWWTLRNHLGNFKCYWIGIMPIGDRYEWRTPEENGWIRIEKEGKHWVFDYWKKKWRIPLPWILVRFFGWEAGIGWKDDGVLGGRFRRD